MLNFIYIGLIVLLSSTGNFSSNAFKISKSIDKTYYFGAVENENTYQDQLITDLYQATNSDKITIILNSRGGDVDRAIDLMTALRATHANLTVIVDRMALSAGGLIALTRPEVLKIKSHSVFMVHYAVTQDIFGNWIMTDRALNPVIDVFDYQTLELYTGLLTEQDIKVLDKGGMVFINGHTIAQRLCKNRGLCDAEIK